MKNNRVATPNNINIMTAAAGHNRRRKGLVMGGVRFFTGAAPMVFNKRAVLGQKCVDLRDKCACLKWDLCDAWDDWDPPSHSSHESQFRLGFCRDYG